MKGFVVVVSGAAGSGKGTVISELVKSNPDVKYSISCTTRAPRPGETDGVDYHFISRENFEDMIKRGEFLEHAFVHMDYYGTPKTKVDEAIENGGVIILEIDVQGMEEMIKTYPDAVTVFIIPPSFQELENRLRKRGTESEESIKVRMENAKKEILKVKEYSYVVVNDDFVEAAKTLNSIIIAERAKTSRNRIRV